MLAKLGLEGRDGILLYILLQGHTISPVPRLINLFFEIKICASVLLEILPPNWEIRSDPKFYEKSDPDPNKIISDPQHWR